MDHLIQIAGVLDEAEAQMLLAAGADWLGFPLRLAYHKEDISDAEAARIIRSLDLGGRAVLITYLDRADEIARLCADLGLQKVQLHGDVATEEIQRLRAARPGLFVIKSLIVCENNLADLERIVALCAPCVDAFITDTFDARTGARGATGRTHDWRVSARLTALSPKPVILAGGLTPDNVREAIRAVRPAGVDAHTGLEGPDGRKDSRLVEAFIANARAAFRE